MVYMMLQRGWWAEWDCLYWTDGMVDRRKRERGTSEGGRRRRGIRDGGMMMMDGGRVRKGRSRSGLFDGKKRRFGFGWFWW
jgi:hypothetical protein